MGLDTFNETIPLVVNVQIALADGVTPKTILTTPAAIGRVDRIYLTSTAAAPHDVALYSHSGTANYIIAVVSVPAGAGTSAIPPVDLITAMVGSPGGIAILTPQSLYMGVLVTLSGAEVINAVVLGGYL